MTDPLKPLAGKTAIVTGSNSGIGLGVARELARAGADVVLNSYTDTEEDHAYWLEIQLGLIDRIGLQNYLQSQMGGPGE